MILAFYVILSLFLQFIVMLDLNVIEKYFWIQG